MTKPTMIIWGAGNIGRGFIADLFYHSGYRIVLVDTSPALVAQLNERGGFTVVRNTGQGRRTDAIIANYCAYTPQENEALAREFEQCDLMALAVYPSAFEEAAVQLLPYLKARDGKRGGAPLDILICTNLMHAGAHLRTALEKAGAKTWASCLRDRIGLVDTLVIRMVPQAPADERRKDPLLVWTNGYPTLTVDQTAFRNPIPHAGFLRPVKDMHAEEMRKLYTYNMAHAVLAYHGALRGHRFITECLADPKVHRECVNALEETRLALQAAYGFGEAEMQAWNATVLSDMDNPALQDTVRRDAADPARKLRREDRLIGAARLAAGQGLPANALLRAAGAAMRYRDPEDGGAAALQDMIACRGVRRTITEVCGLAEDPAIAADMTAAIEDAYWRLPLELHWEALAARAYEEGFDAEKRYHGCGQCVLYVLMNILGNFEPAVFNAATGLSGGLGLYGKATCSALTGSVLAVSMQYPRTVEEFDGARENKYTTFAVAQRLIERFNARYGSILCHDVHTNRMGRPFDLRNKDDRAAFEAAGAHAGECTDTVGLAARWAVEALAEIKIAEEVHCLKSAG